MQPNFYPRPPRGGRHCEYFLGFGARHISIHALREEGDASCFTRFFGTGYFYPRPPRGGRRSFVARSSPYFPFLSTPSARRATSKFVLSALPFGNFYPRPPRGGRRFTCMTASSKNRFLSTPSARRATQIGHLCVLANLFLSTPSARRATQWSAATSAQKSISIHALREEGDPLRSGSGR